MGRFLVKRNCMLLVAILILSSTFAPMLIENVWTSDDERVIQEQQAIHVKTPKASDYAYIEQSLGRINVSSTHEYRLDFFVKVLGFSAARPGTILQFDILDSDSIVRFSFRLKSDYGLSYHYPFSSSSVAFSQKDSWQLAKWHKYEIRITENRSFFYINNSLIGESSSDFPALIQGYTLSKIRLGEVDDKYYTFEGFIDNLRIYEDEDLLYFEDFEDDLKDYIIEETEGSILEIIDAESYTTLSLKSDYRNIEAGEVVTLTCVLRDSYNVGLVGKQIHLQYFYQDKTVDIAIGETTIDGTLNYSWRVPNKLKGSVPIYYKYLGDESYSGSTSNYLSLFITNKPFFSLNSQFIVLLLSFSLVLLFVYTSKEFGLEKSSLYLFIISLSTGSLLSLIMLAKTLGIEYYLAYEPQPLNIELFSHTMDSMAWIISLAGSFVGFLIYGWLRKKFSRRMLIAYFVLFTSFVLFFFESNFYGTLIAFLTSIFLIAFSTKHARSLFSISEYKLIQGFLLAPFLIILSIEAISIAGWIFNVFDPHVPFDNSFRWFFPSIELNLSNILYPLTPFLVMAVLLSWIWVPFIKVISNKLFRNFPSSLFVHSYNSQSLRVVRWAKWPTLLMAIVCALFLSYYPYFYSSRLVGVDTSWYYERLVTMTDWSGAFGTLTSFEGASRWVYLLLLYSMKHLTGLSADSVVRIGPFIPASFLALATYILINVITKDRILALLSSFLAAFSINTTVGMFAGIFANWLAISWTLLLFAVLLYAPNKGFRFSIPATFMLSFLILITHSWTWILLMITLITFMALTLIYRYLKGGRKKLGKDFMTVTFILLSNFALVLGFLIIMPGSELIKLSYEVWNTVSLAHFFEFLPNLALIVRLYVGGFFGNPVIYLLAIFGLITLRDLENPFNRLIISVLIPASLIGFLIGPFWLWRILYMVPYQILATLGFAFIMNAFKKLSHSSSNIGGTEDRVLKHVMLIILLLIVLSQFNYALRCVNYIRPI